MNCPAMTCAMPPCARFFISRSAAPRCGFICRTRLESLICTSPQSTSLVPLSTSSSSIDPATDQQLTFAGKPDVIVPPGAEFISDPLSTKVASLSDLAVTFHLDNPPARQTSHPGSRATSYYVHGDAAGAATLLEPKHVDHWFQISEIDVQAPPEAAAIVVLGDSITDGHGATTNGNDRWTDVLAARLQGHRPRHERSEFPIRASVEIIC